VTGPPSIPGRRFGEGILVAVTTPFDARGEIDLAAAAAHARWLLDEGMDGIVIAGSLGEGASLAVEERVALLRAVGAAVPPDRALLMSVGAAATRDAVALARRAAEAGARGLLVLPPYVYRGDPRETEAHLEAVLGATDLPAMLYNNPAAYGVDLRPEPILDLAERCPTLAAVKESSGDVRRITALRALLGDRVEIAVGLDDAIVEGIGAGARGWVAGLANAFPAESRLLFDAARGHDRLAARALYEWFLPLLRLDTDPKFVQEIKLVQSEVGRGSPAVRPPRRELTGPERDAVVELVRERRARRARLEPPAKS
jgi:1-pyrroline-4-hydroxy-2-carboxylate deaminase